VNAFDDIRKCVGLLLFPCFEFLLFSLCFVRLLRECRAYRGSSSSTGSFLFGSSFKRGSSSIICFEISVVLLEFAVVIV
jgi:hypothetical protein